MSITENQNILISAEYEIPEAPGYFVNERGEIRSVDRYVFTKRGVTVRRRGVKLLKTKHNYYVLRINKRTVYLNGDVALRNAKRFDESRRKLFALSEQAPLASIEIHGNDVIVQKREFEPFDTLKDSYEPISVYIQRKQKFRGFVKSMLDKFSLMAYKMPIIPA